MNEYDHLSFEIYLYNKIAMAFTIAALFVLVPLAIMARVSGFEDLAWFELTIPVGWAYVTAGLHFFIHRVRPVRMDLGSKWETSRQRTRMSWMSSAYALGQIVFIASFVFDAESRTFHQSPEWNNFWLAMFLLGCLMALIAPRAGKHPDELKRK